MSSVVSTARAADADVQMMVAACQLAQKCTPVDSAYNVGAVLLDSGGHLIATGYSRELPGNTHAEQCALLKAEEAERSTEGGTIYSSMEPCSTRLSGNESCTSRIIKAGIQRVVLAEMEPAHFVKCEGIKILQAAGIQVDVCSNDEIAMLVNSVNAHIGGSSGATASGSHSSGAVELGPPVET